MIISKLNIYIICFALIITPFLQIYEILNIINKGGRIEIFLADIYTPIWVKMIKDFIFLALFGTSIIFLLIKRRAHKSIILFLIMLIIVLMSFTLTVVEKPLNAIAGVRWILPFLTMFLLVGQLDSYSLEKILKYIVPLFIIHFLFQIIEVGFYASYGVSNFLGIESRVGGIFLNSNVGGIFSCFIFYFLTNFNYSTKYLKMYKVFCIISIFLTASATCMIILSTLISINYSYKHGFQKIILLILPIIALLIFFNLRTLTGRDTEKSISIRGQSFSEAIFNTKIISTNFGSATNTAYQLRRIGYTIQTIGADSNYTAMLVNFGYLGFIIIIAMLFSFLYIAFEKKYSRGISLTLMFMLSSVSMMSFEGFPINLLFAMTFSIIIKEQNNFNNIKVTARKTIIY